MRVKETDGLGNPTIPAGYNQPNFSIGTAVQTMPGPDSRLLADTAASTTNGIDPLNRGFSVGGAQDPLSELERSQDNPAGLDIGGGNPSAPMNAPSHQPTANMHENDPSGIDESDNPFCEMDNPFKEDDPPMFPALEALPDFEDIGDDPAISALPVDADGVINPVVIPDETIMEPELGDIPDVTLPLEEPIVEIDADDVDVQIPENVFENDGIPESIPVMESFRLPENQSVVVSKGDQIFLIGHVREEFTPKFAESVFTRALKSICEGKNVQATMNGNKNEKVAIVGRSLLVEVAKDWRLPGTTTIFEAHDLLQIVSAKPIQEGEDVKEDDSKDDDKKKDDKAKEESEPEKLKKEYILAYRRWRESEKKRNGGKTEDEDSEDDEEDDPDKKKAEERAKREAAMLDRLRTGNLL